jgi:acyl dehydratase
MATVLDGVDAVRKIAGSELGTSPWREITQEQVNTFADATGDHQWIHVDTERAKDGPYGGTIAHGFLTLSLIPVLFAQTVKVTGIRMALNYGLNKVRFPQPVPVGSRLRAQVRNQAVDDVTGGVQATYQITIEMEGATKPVCVAEFISRYVG